MERISRLLSHLGPAEQTQVMFPFAPLLPCTCASANALLQWLGLSHDVTSL